MVAARKKYHILTVNIMLSDSILRMSTMQKPTYLKGIIFLENPFDKYGEYELPFSFGRKCIDEDRTRIM